VSGTSKEHGAVGFTDFGGLLLNQLLTGGRQTTPSYDAPDPGVSESALFIGCAHPRTDLVFDLVA